jgi:hypothetical protein
MRVYTVTVIDVESDPVMGMRSTPAIFTNLTRAIAAVKNNECDIADDKLYQYAVIEESYLDVIRPDMDRITKKYWFKYNETLEEFEPFVPTNTHPVFKLSGFGIG